MAVWILVTSVLCGLQQSTIEQVDREAGIQVGVRVENFAGEVVFDFHGEQSMVVASNMKLITTATALAGLGPDFRWTTQAWLQNGSLWIRGNGDPSLRLTPSGDFGKYLLNQLAEKIRAQGQYEIHELVVDGRAFQGPARPLSWPANQWQNEYCAPVSSLAVGGNCLTATFLNGWVHLTPQLSPTIRFPYGSKKSQVAFSMSWKEADKRLYFKGGTFRDGDLRLAFQNPLEVFGRWIKSGLEKRGIDIGRIRVATAAESAPSQKPILTHMSAWTLADAVMVANKDSDNFVAEILFRTLGQYQGDGSPEDSRLEIRRQLKKLQVPLQSLLQADGSGMGRDKDERLNRISPANLCCLLRSAAYEPWAEVFFDSLVIGGKEGRLKNRFKESLFSGGKVRAKTGWIKGASSLGGYLLVGETPLVFSIVVNYQSDGKPRTNNARFRELQEDILRALMAQGA